MLGIYRITRTFCDSRRCVTWTFDYYELVRFVHSHFVTCPFRSVGLCSCTLCTSVSDLITGISRSLNKPGTPNLENCIFFFSKNLNFNFFYQKINPSYLFFRTAWVSVSTSYIRVQWLWNFLRIQVIQKFLDRDWDPKRTIPNYIFCLQPLLSGFRISVSKKFLLKVSNMGIKMSIILCWYQIWRNISESLQHWKYGRTQNFFEELGIFRKSYSFIFFCLCTWSEISFT